MEESPIKELWLRGREERKLDEELGERNEGSLLLIEWSDNPDVREEEDKKYVGEAEKNNDRPVRPSAVESVAHLLDLKNGARVKKDVSRTLGYRREGKWRRT